MIRVVFSSPDEMYSLIRPRMDSEHRISELEKECSVKDETINGLKEELRKSKVVGIGAHDTKAAILRRLFNDLLTGEKSKSLAIVECQYLTGMDNVKSEIMVNSLYDELAGFVKNSK